MILGLDVSTSITGATILDKEGEVLYNEAWDTRKFKNFFVKAAYIEEKIVHLNKLYGGFEKVFIEQSLQTFRSGFSSAKTLSTLSRFNGIVSWLVYRVLQTEPEYIAATSARKLCGIRIPRGVKAKGVVIQYVLDKVPGVTIQYTKFNNPKPECYDKADSWVIAKAGHTLCQREKKLQILKEVLGNCFNSGEEYLFYCPKCNHHKKKLSVNLDKNAFKCWICDYVGTSLRRLIRKYGDYNHLSRWSELTDEVDLTLFSDDLFATKEVDLDQRLSIPTEFKSLANKNLPLTSQNAQIYLKDRGLTKKDVIYWKIGYCEGGQYDGRILIPSFSEDGYCNYFVTRTYIGDWKKYLNPTASKDIIFNDLYLDFDSDLVLVEGVFDAIVAGPNSAPLLGSTLKDTSQLFQKIVRNDTPVYVALDPDASKKEDSLIRKLLRYGVQVHKVDISPFNDVGEMTKEEFKFRKSQAVYIEEDTYMLTKALMAI